MFERGMEWCEQEFDQSDGEKKEQPVRSTSFVRL